MIESDPLRLPSASRTEAAPHQTWTVVLASIGVLMTALDTLVVTTSLPVLRTSLHAGLSSLEWTVNAYNLSFACLLLTGAALGDRFGRRRMFTIGVGVFTAASALSALSPSVGALIAARALQGAGAAIVMPLTLTLISEAFPTEKRGVAIGLWGGIQGLAVAAGPVVGGAIAGGINWHWIFWLNVPIGLALMPLAARRLSESFGPRPQLDIGGLTLAAAAAFGVTWALVRADSAGWGSVEIIGSLGAGLVLAGLFVGWERRSRTPMLQLEFFRDRTFASANAVSFFMYAALFGTLFLMSQFFQVALGRSPLDAGLDLLPWTGAPMVVAPIAGALSERYGNRPFMAAGLALQTIGLTWIAVIAAPGVGYLQLGLALTIAGIGISLCFPTVANAVMGSVPLQGGRCRLGNEQHAARARRRPRNRRSCLRVRPPRRLPLTARLHRRVHPGAVGRRRALRDWVRGGAPHADPQTDRACQRRVRVGRSRRTIACLNGIGRRISGAASVGTCDGNQRPELPRHADGPYQLGGCMTIADKTVLVTGANRGIGQALVEEALRRGAKRVYAGTRQPLSHSDRRVTPLALDVTDAAQIQAAVERVESLDILINNAGIALYDDLSDRAALEQSLAVNLFGPWAVTQAFLPLLTRSRGAIVNNVSTMALAPLPLTPAYAISKAAAFNLTQSLRALLAGRGVTVHAVLTGPTDTDMTRGFDIPKASAESVARAIFDGVENGEEDIFPDPMSETLAETWRSGAAKAMERENAALVQAVAVAA